MRLSWVRLFLVLAALLVLARLRVALVEVLDTDETIFHTAAGRLLAGERLYDEVVDIKPPGIFLFYALVRWLVGPGLFAVHHVTTLVVVGTAAAVAIAARRASGDARSAFSGAAVYLVAHGVGDASTGAASSTEQLAALPVAAAMALLLGGRSPARGVAAGALLGIAALFKPQAGAAAAAAILALAVGPDRRPGAAAALAGGVAAPLVGTWAVFAAHGLGDEMVRWSLTEGFSYATREAAPWLRGLPNLLAFLGLQALPVLAATWGLRREVTGFPRRLLAAWALLALLATAAGGRFYWNYFILLTVPLAVAAGAATPALWDRLRRSVRVAVVVVALLPSLGSQAWLARQEHAGRGSLRAGHEELAREAKRHLRAGDEIVAFGSAAPIYYATGRNGATRFLSTDYVFGFLDPTLFEDPDEILRHALPERLRELEGAIRDPRVRVVVDAPYSAWRNYSLERVPEVAAAVRAEYGLVHRGTRGGVWVRLTRPRVAP